MSAPRDPAPPITAEQVRLLTLSRSDETGEPTQKMETFNKTDPALRYVAISYAWQDDTPVSELPLDDGRCLPLSRTLSGLVDALRQWSLPVTVWIDALCINQADPVEKAAQVRSMGAVYAGAQRVVVWLGLPNDDMSLAWAYLQRTRHLAWPQGWDTADARHGLDAVFCALRRPWFRRLWVLQEAARGRDVVFACGRLPLVRFAHFRNCVWAVWRHCERVSTADWRDDSSRGLRCFTRLLEIRRRFVASGEVPFELLLQAGRLCEAKDPRDKIFGLQGIAAQCHAVPGPDYSVPLDDVRESGFLERLYTQTSRALLTHGPSMDLLGLAGLAERDASDSTPSWVVNMDVCDGEALTMADRGQWNSGGTVKMPVQSPSPERLLITALATDFVVKCCRPMDFEDIQDLQECAEEMMRLQHGVSSEDERPARPSRAWSERVMRSIILGLDIDDNPVASAEYFAADEWLRVLRDEKTHLHPNLAHENVFHRTAFLRADGWKLGLTQQGRLVIGPAMLTAGDLICVVPGCRFPIALKKHWERHEQSGGQDGASATAQLSCRLISWCYVDGWMHGQQSGSTGARQSILLL